MFDQQPSSTPPRSSVRRSEHWPSGCLARLAATPESRATFSPKSCALAHDSMSLYLFDALHYAARRRALREFYEQCTGRSRAW